MPYTDILPSKAQIFDHWKDRFRDLGIFIDWGEPSCWACGFHYGTKYDIKSSNAGWNEIFDGWDRVPLQRCHIVPRSLGGTDEPSNLFLMCRECHDSAPNTALPEIFFEWARTQSYSRRESAKIEEALRSFGVRSEQHNKLLQLIESSKFRDWIDGKLGLHRPQSNYASLSCRLTPATMVGLAVHYLRLDHPRVQ
jgi:5-methylcytosine-specific restriction endonuclease McrA